MNKRLLSICVAGAIGIFLYFVLRYEPPAPSRSSVFREQPLDVPTRYMKTNTEREVLAGLKGSIQTG